ncbi:hypothetical protein chiPu_0018242 [Chiloscyllium punctatum]|uniref:Uncharacterized protein n=1 Tax=Chiloscyllium punctatum TaxID=137246 RepID=A0A401RM41_CHIPU|nr:hypothetical protein [Chiloscyllium punctatum]
MSSHWLLLNLTYAVEKGELLFGLQPDLVQGRKGFVEQFLTYLNNVFFPQHDTTLVALQMALNVYSGTIPSYASCHMFELYQEDDGSFTLDMYFRNDTRTEPHLLVLPSCSEHCPLETFIQNTKDLISDNRDEECKFTSPAPSSIQTERIVIAVLSVCLLLLILMLIALYCFWKRKTHHHRVPSNSEELA